MQATIARLQQRKAAGPSDNFVIEKTADDKLIEACNIIAAIDPATVHYKEIFEPIMLLNAKVKMLLDESL